MDRPPLPPFTLESAVRNVRLAEDAWQAYTVDSRWRNRSEFLQGSDAIAAFLERITTTTSSGKRPKSPASALGR